MPMSRSIVCGIDNSPEARRAAELTVKLARVFGAEPILVHAIDGARAFGYGKSVLRARRREHALRAGAQLAAEMDPRGEATERILCDRPERALAQVASDTGARPEVGVAGGNPGIRCRAADRRPRAAGTRRGRAGSETSSCARARAPEHAPANQCGRCRGPAHGLGLGDPLPTGNLPRRNRARGRSLPQRP